MGKNNSHAVEMAEHDPLLRARDQRSTPNLSPEARQKPAYAGRGADPYYLRDNVGRNIAQSWKRTLRQQKAEVRPSYH